jgi:hypothetical protein
MIHRNPGFGRRFLHPAVRATADNSRCQQLRPLSGGPQLFGELIARRAPARPSRSVPPMLPHDAHK